MNRATRTDIQTMSGYRKSEWVGSFLTAPAQWQSALFAVSV